MGCEARSVVAKKTNTHIHTRPVEGDLRQKPRIARRGGTCWWDVSWEWLPTRNTRLHAISYIKMGLSSLTHSRVLRQALARSLRESKVQFAVEDACPSLPRASEQNGRLDPLRMDIATEAEALFGNHPDARIRRLYSTLPSLTLAPAPI